MSDIRRVFSGSPWEAKVGYCRAVRAGPLIWVTGTVAINVDGSPHAPGDAGAQAERCFEIIARALGELGASLQDIVRTRMFVTDISRWEEIGAVHGRVFEAHPPATTMVEVSRFIGSEFLIEIEADAFVAEG